jgi:hypothetical protein
MRSSGGLGIHLLHVGHCLGAKQKLYSDMPTSGLMSHIDDVTEMTREGRQAFMWAAPMYVLRAIMESLMKDGRPVVDGCRFDALTIYTLRR